MPAESTELRDVDALLRPTSVAVVGASERRPALLLGARSSGAVAGTTVFAVNPGHDEVLGTACFPSIAALPERPGLAALVVGHLRLLEAASEAIDAGVRALFVPGLGAEAGAQARPLVAKLAELAESTGTAVLGPNCMGYARPEGLSLWIGSVPSSMRPGTVSILAQSGSVADGLVALGGRVGFDVVVSSGGEASRDAADFVGAFASAETTTAIGLFLETVRRTDALSKALVACAEANKPVVCLKVGRTAAAARIALAHTGALVGSARACSAYLRAHGVIEVEDLPDLVETLEVLGRRRRPRGTRLAAISESGGETELLADHASDAGLVLSQLPEGVADRLSEEFPNYGRAENPLDAWAVDEASLVFPRSLELLAESGAYDVLVAQVDLTQYRVHQGDDWCQMIVEGLVEAAKDRDVFPAVVSSHVNDPPPEIAEVARRGDVALLRGARAATRALAAVANWTVRRPERAPEASGISLAGLLSPGAMSEAKSAAVLGAYGVRFADHGTVSSAREAAALAERIGFPVVVKADGPAHKAAQGGVFLDLRDAAAVEAAAAALGGRVLVASQVPTGAEILCGMLRDPVFGPVVLVGLGGGRAEATDQVALAMAPLGLERAEALVDSASAVAPLLHGGARRRVVETLVALSTVAIEHEAIEAIDVNPLVVTGDDAVAVDALVVVRSDQGDHQWKS